MSEPVSATLDGVTVESNTGTAADLAASLETPPAAAPGEGTPTAAPADGGKPAAAPAAQSTPDGEPDPASEAGKQLSKRRRDMQAAIDKATWEKHEATRRAEKLEAELEALRNPKPTAQASAEDGPDLDDYVAQIGIKYDTYEKAVQAHARDLVRFELSARDKASVAEQSSRARNDALLQTYTRGVAAHADFDAVLGEFAQSGGRLAPTTPAEAQGPLGDLEQVILTHPQGHAVAYALAKDAELYQRIVTAPTRVMFMAEMGELLTRLKGAPTGSPSEPAPVSRAKPPVQPAKGQPQATGGPPGDDASDEEHLRYYNQQEKARRRA